MILNVSLENVINKIQNETTEYLTSKNIKTNVNYFNDYKNDTFNFKIYVRNVFLIIKCLGNLMCFFWIIGVMTYTNYHCQMAL